MPHDASSDQSLQSAAPVHRPGPRSLPAHLRIQERPTVGLYEEDRQALAILRDAGYVGKTPKLMRMALRLLAAQVSDAKDRGRLPV